MAYAQTSTISLLIDASLTNSNDLSTSTDKVFKSYLTALAAGTGDGQASNMWHDQRTLAASATEDLDFASSLTSTVTGAVLLFTKIKALLVYAHDANTNDVVLSRPASNGLVIFGAASDAYLGATERHLLRDKTESGYHRHRWHG